MRSKTLCAPWLRSKIESARTSCEATNLTNVERWSHQKRQPLPRPYFSDSFRQCGSLVGTFLRRQQNQIVSMSSPKTLRVVHAARSVNFYLMIPEDIGPQGLLDGIRINQKNFAMVGVQMPHFHPPI